MKCGNLAWGDGGRLQGKGIVHTVYLEALLGIDEIDQYVDRFYREKEEASNREILYGEVIAEDWRMEQIDDLVAGLKEVAHG